MHSAVLIWFCLCEFEPRFGLVLGPSDSRGSMRASIWKDVNGFFLAVLTQLAKMDSNKWERPKNFVSLRIWSGPVQYDPHVKPSPVIGVRTSDVDVKALELDRKDLWDLASNWTAKGGIRYQYYLGAMKVSRGPYTDWPVFHRYPKRNWHVLIGCVWST